MTGLGRKMHTICQQFAAVQTLQALNQYLYNYFCSLGIQSIAITYYNANTKTGNKLLYDWVSPPLKVWHQHYLDEGYADIDRTLESSEQSLLPVFWDVQEQLTVAKNKREARIRQESIDFGIDKGISIPVHGAQNDLLVLVLHQRQHENGLANWQENQYNWLTIALCYLHHLRRFLVHEQGATQISLTRRERECLELTSQGLRIDAIAKELGLTVRTVNFHLQNANKKLGVSNKYLAVMRWQQQ